MRRPQRSPYERVISLFGAFFALAQNVAYVNAIPGPIPEPVAVAEAFPNPTPAAFALAEAVPAPAPVAEALPDPDGGGNIYAPFSGAIYIVGGNGIQLSAAQPASCGSAGWQGCGNINIWNWCCPASNTCSMLNNNIVGCCPSGSSCAGTVNGAISTVTVTEYSTIRAPTATVFYPGNTAPSPVTTVGGVFVGPNQQHTTTTTGFVYNGYCSTLYMRGNPIPTTAKGQCGTILILNDGAALHPSWGMITGIVAVQLALGASRIFRARA